METVSPREADPPSSDALKDAIRVDLHLVAATDEAKLLTRAVVSAVEATESRTRRRRKADAEGLYRAVAAILGSVLKATSRPCPALSKHSLRAEGFSTTPVGHRPFKAAITGMKAAGLLHEQPGIRHPGHFGSWQGHAPRWWPTERLIGLAGKCGVDTQAIHAGAFRRINAEAAPAARITEPVRLIAIGDRAFHASAAFRDDARRGVEALNARVSEAAVSGCPPPRFSRRFIGWEGGHGRFYAHARGTVGYQQMPEAERLALLRIGGEPVAEVDASASHLTILHGLLGLSLPQGDLYALPGIPREAVKAWIVQSLGVGQPKRRWKDAKASWPSASAVRHAALMRYPCLADPAAIVPADALPEEPRRRLVTHHLSGIEAKALTAAMEYLWATGKTLRPTDA